MKKLKKITSLSKLQTWATNEMTKLENIEISAVFLEETRKLILEFDELIEIFPAGRLQSANKVEIEEWTNVKIVIWLEEKTLHILEFLEKC